MVSVQPRLTGIFTPSSQAIDELNARKYGREFKGRDPRLPQEVHADEAIKLVQLQKEAGFSLLSDGQFLWGDLLRPVYAGMHGVEIGSQTRWFEVNGFVFPPKVTGQPVPVKESHISEYLQPALLSGNGQVTMVGPYTFLHMAENLSETKFSTGTLVDAVARQYLATLLALPKDIKLIEFCEPAISFDARNPNTITQRGRYFLLDLARSAYEYITRGYSAASSPAAKLLLQIPDGDFNQLFPAVSNFNVDGFGVDLTETVDFLPRVNLEGKILSAGVLNAASSVPENLPWAAGRVRLAVAAWNPAEVCVTTHAQLLHTISYEPAVNKVKELGQLAVMLF